MPPRRLHREARAAPDAPPHGDDTRVMERPPAAMAQPGPAVLMCAIAQAAHDGTGPEHAARLAAALVYLDLQLATLWQAGQLGQVAAADAELRAGPCARCGIPRAEHPEMAADDNGRAHPWYFPGRDPAIGRYRRESAALLTGTGPAWQLPGTDPAAVGELYEAAQTNPGQERWWERHPAPRKCQSPDASWTRLTEEEHHGHTHARTRADAVRLPALVHPRGDRPDPRRSRPPGQPRTRQRDARTPSP